MTIHHLHPRDDSHRSPESWLRLIESAAAVQEVIARVREFMASFTPYELETLPEGLRPRKLLDPQDVSDYAFDLIQARLERGDREGSAGSAMLRTFSEVMSHAAVRLAEIASNEARDDDQRSA